MQLCELNNTIQNVREDAKSDCTIYSRSRRLLFPVLVVGGQELVQLLVIIVSTVAFVVSTAKVVVVELEVIVINLLARAGGWAHHPACVAGNGCTNIFSTSYTTKKQRQKHGQG